MKFRRQPSSASAELVRPGGLVPNLSRSPSRRTVSRAPRRCWSAEFFGLLVFCRFQCSSLSVGFGIVFLWFAIVFLWFAAVLLWFAIVFFVVRSGFFCGSQLFCSPFALFGWWMWLLAGWSIFEVALLMVVRRRLRLPQGWLTAAG